PPAPRGRNPEPPPRAPHLRARRKRPLALRRDSLAPALLRAAPELPQDRPTRAPCSPCRLVNLERGQPDPGCRSATSPKSRLSALQKQADKASHGQKSRRSSRRLACLKVVRLMFRYRARPSAMSPAIGSLKRTP